MEVFYTIGTHERVEVYSYLPDGKNAYGFIPNRVNENGKGGWNTIQLKTLIPEAYADKYIAGFHSKTERNRIKQRLELALALWRCTDGSWAINLDDAIDHERELMSMETDDEQEN